MQSVMYSMRRWFGRTKSVQTGRQMTFFSKCLGLAEAYVEINGAIRDWAIDRTDDGIVAFLGKVSVSISFTRRNKKTLLAVSLGLVMYVIFVLSGERIGNHPLEVAAWALLARKFTA